MNKTPYFAPTPVPTMTGHGTASAMAQGQEMTRIDRPKMRPNTRSEWPSVSTMSCCSFNPNSQPSTQIMERRTFTASMYHNTNMDSANTTMTGTNHDAMRSAIRCTRVCARRDEKSRRIAKPIQREPSALGLLLPTDRYY